MVGILLAAGFSRRFGPSNKLLQPLPDGYLIAQVAAKRLIEATPTSVAEVRSENKILADLLQDEGSTCVFAVILIRKWRIACP